MLFTCIFYIPNGLTRSDHVHNIALYSQLTCYYHVHFIYHMGQHALIVFIIYVYKIYMLGACWLRVKVYIMNMIVVCVPIQYIKYTC